MKKKNVLIITSVLALSLVFSGCSKKEDPVSEAPVATEVPAPEEAVSEEMREEAPGEVYFTLEELSAFNGKNGQLAYIAVDGIVYDVTDLPAWKDGGHNGFEAGQDLTEAIKSQSPHGVSKLETLPIVGRLK